MLVNEGKYKQNESQNEVEKTGILTNKPKSCQTKIHNRKIIFD